MAPNVLGNTLLLAEACIEPEDRNKNGPSVGTLYKSKAILNVATSKPARLDELKVRCIVVQREKRSFRWIQYASTAGTDSRICFCFWFSLQHNDTTKKVQESRPKRQYNNVYVWRNIIAFIYLHLGFLYGSYLLLTSAKWSTFLFGK